MKLLRFMFIAYLVVVLTGCHESLDAKVKNGAAIHVSSPNGEYDLKPSDPRYQKLISWYQDNRDGWSPYYATTPVGGIIVSTDNLRIEFFGNSAIYLGRDKALSKGIKESDYAYLKPDSGT